MYNELVLNNKHTTHLGERLKKGEERVTCWAQFTLGWAFGLTFQREFCSIPIFPTVSFNLVPTTMQMSIWTALCTSSN